MAKKNEVVSVPLDGVAEEEKPVLQRAWTFEFYPESAPENWRELLDRLRVPLFACLHDKDVKEDGTIKKPHVHVALYFGGKKSLEQTRKIAKRFGVDFAEPVLDWLGMCRYLCHLDNPEKAQYPLESVIELGGLHYRATCISKDEQSQSDTKRLTSLIRSFDLVDWCDVVAFVFDTAPELLPELKKYAYFYSSIVKSNNEKKMRGMNTMVVKQINYAVDKARAEWSVDHTYVDSRELPPVGDLPPINNDEATPVEKYYGGKEWREAE